jgi:hypothetical protein
LAPARDICEGTRTVPDFEYAVRRHRVLAAIEQARRTGLTQHVEVHMTVDLPQPIATYIAAENRRDTEALVECFAEHAVVRDEGKTIEGLAAIKRWKAETSKKYQHTVEPLALTQKGDKTIVTNRLTGHFPGSPIELQFVFRLEGNKIASLEIGS